ncbi:hypothetical protein BU24DRAFT_466642 [Aaosphaeria arxii CBS 175.79]|uniref:Uncharacterized protein n=1 Tax=Aaosphaeria arxii CBS 175.79 TaxID=1450172 RepID=A0A6A5XDE3_9PLEO|nr:uncharacterized protein BU24DRAFT_466642 [Aaosphaeria arxii CBS 175.79]KAF2010883.1 hypothetical protein BU24DRAFT_466642 [Aaosphaeria arxii CBS 175.79]
MALRTRLRRAFTRGSSDEGSGGPLSRITSRSSKKDKPKPDPNVYQPGEKMPPMKYRRPVDPIHKKNLEAFNWATSWRRKSDPSVYSPMGSRMPSRKNSHTTLGRRSIGGRKTSSRADDSAVDSGFGGSISGDTDHPSLLREGSEEEGDVTNVGLSRPPTNDRPRKSSSIHGRRSHSIHRTLSNRSGGSRPPTKDGAIRRSGSSRGEPFTPAELELALKRSHLETPKEESDRSGDGSPNTPSNGQLKLNRQSI